MQETAFTRDVRRRVMLRDALQTPEIAERFWAKVDQSLGADGCWPWLGSRDPRGYGQFMVRYGYRFERAHRFAWSFWNRRLLPMDRMACHTCDNPSCCNPLHLYAGTVSQNARDARNRGRLPWARLNTEKAAAIREDLTSSTAELAERYGVTPAAIWFVRKGGHWNA